MNTKHKPSRTVLINEKLEPMIIEMGKIENNIIGKFVLTFSNFFIKLFCTLFFLIYELLILFFVAEQGELNFCLK